METKRLILRKARLEDATDIYHVRNSEYVLRYNCMKAWTFDQTIEMVIKDINSPDIFYIEQKETGRVIGCIDLSEDSLRYGVNSLCLSYYLGEDHGGNGYMTEALREILRHAFEDRRVEVITVRAFKCNSASVRVIEKLGFVYEGCLRKGVMGYQDIIYDDMLYSMLKEEYDELYARNKSENLI